MDLVPTLTHYEGYPKRWKVMEEYADGSFKLAFEDWTDYDWKDLILIIWPPSTGKFRIQVPQIPQTSNRFEFFNGDKFLVTLYGTANNEPGKINPTFPVTILNVPSADLLAADYGMSRGVYETPTSKSMRIDPRLIFILDYPKEVADYSCTPDEWPKFFIKDPAEWEKTYGKAAAEWGYSWRTYQSLRHFGKANVLFCDGRVETVGVDRYGTATPNDVLSGRYLDETNPLWKYQGN